jgi:iron(III) transport system permease protein
MATTDAPPRPPAPDMAAGGRRASRFDTTSAANLGALLVLSVLVALPLALILWRAIAPDGDLAMGSAIAVLGDGTNLEVVRNTIVLGLLVIVGATLVAAPLAFLMSRTSFRRQRWLDVLIIVPFMTPPYINSIAWITFMRDRGVAEQWFGAFASPFQSAFFSVFGMAMIMSFNLFPFLYLILRNSLDNIGASPEEAGAVHGGSFRYRLRRITVPLLLSGYSMGILLVFVKSAGEFGTPITLGNRIGFYVLVSEIYQNTSIFPLDLGAAAVLSTVLLSMGVTAWFVQQWFVARRNDRVISGRAQKPAMVELGVWRWPARLWVGGTLLLAIGVPYFTVFASALTRLESAGLVWSNLTLLNFQVLFTPSSGALTAIGNSVRLALLAATISAIIGIVVALLAVKQRGPVPGTIDFLSLAPNTVPAIVVIVGLIFAWNSTWMPLPVYNTIWMLVLAYVVLYLPFSVQNVKAVYSQLGDTLFEAASVAGGSWWFRTRRILLPLIMPGVLAGWIMAFTISMRELVGSLLVRPPSVHVISTYIFREFEQGNRSLGMAVAVVGVFTTTLVLILTDNYRNRLAARRAA